ncbi:restriction endonuclease [Paenibacillus polymyxa]|uniref:nSTAND3 domain-containing NTPase n=2 Tax=Paenibacillus polymyxa TaxID=1406 RepID=UPI001FB2FDEC|nr:restriction endonuclease [Paenibacillus polymyxa]MCJ1220164.1 restriction endonuclease [Paenibacillus polymyxa]
MNQYNFNVFSPPEFEEFSRDLLQEHLQISFESFKDGKDGGIDFRYSVNLVNNIIVQCKRYKDFETLFRELKKEIKKVDKLIPERYILSTSVDLTKHQKDEILKLFNGYIKKNSDIIGSKDLNNFLSKYPKLEKKYYKLWLSSTNVLTNILHGSIYNRSDFTQEEILKNISLYVENTSIHESYSILSKYNYVIISGIPGIGKTTLAKMLIYKYVSEGYKLIQISRDIDEAESVFIRGENQIYFYNDFLGKVFLEQKLQKNEEIRIIQFLRKIKKDKSKKLVMSTREYIFQQAKSYYDEFEKLDSCIIDLEKYNEKIRAKILYNHLFFSDVPQEYIERLIQRDNFIKIIKHRNYSPRIIEFLTFDYEEYCDNGQNYFNSFMNLLNNPKKLWKRPFEKHITLVSRYFLRVLFILGGYAHTDDIKKALESLIAYENKSYTISYHREDFFNSLVELNKSFINNENDLITFQNPSIQDFLLYNIASNIELITGLLESALYFDQLFTVFGSPKSKTGRLNVNKSIMKVIEQLILERFESLRYSRFARSNKSLNENFNKLMDINNFFHFESFPEIEKLYVEKLQSEVNKNNDSEVVHLLSLISNVKDQITWDKDKLVLSLIDSIDSLDNTDDISLLEELFPEEYDEFHYEIESKFEEMINWEIFIIDEEDIDELNDLKDKIEHIELNFSMSFCTQITDLEDMIEELENNNEDEVKEKQVIIDTRKEINFQNQKDDLIAMFRSLKK